MPSCAVGIVGASVGHALAHTLALQGLCGALRLADFVELELPNLNRLPATVFDLGVNKAVVAARRIAELDPFLSVDVMTDGLTPESIDEFFEGLNVVVEECDSLEMKVLVRQAARAHRLPVLMATSDRGLLDVERFDLQPERPILHGLLSDVDGPDLGHLSTVDKVPYVLRLLDPAALSARGAASLLEIGHTLSTWPQLAGDVSSAPVLSPRLSAGSASVSTYPQDGCGWMSRPLWDHSASLGDSRRRHSIHSRRGAASASAGLRGRIRCRRRDSRAVRRQRAAPAHRRHRFVAHRAPGT